jgi:hypothetical protein
MDCLRHWTFRPALDRNGNPVTAQAQVEIYFSLPELK